IPFIGAGASVTALPKLAERIESVLQSQFKAVKRLLQEHSEALIAIAEALIERDELVAEEIKQLIDEADARRVTKTVLADFETILSNGNGHTNGKANGHALIGAPGSGQLIDAPKPESTEKFSLDGEMGTMSTNTISPADEEPFFFMGG